MEPLVASVLLAGATATIGYFFQARETRLRQEADAKQENEALQELAPNME